MGRSGDDVEPFIDHLAQIGDKINMRNPRYGVSSGEPPSLLLALSGHSVTADQCPLSGVKRTWRRAI
jgi:hypothetical protein